MVLAPLVVTALVVIIFLQVITIVKINMVAAKFDQKSDDRKQVLGPTAPKQEKRRDNRENRDKRKNKRNDNNAQTQKQNSVTSSVDRSLRDINLRLKNAERDQEKMRKKLNDGDSKNSKKNTDKERSNRHLKRRSFNNHNNHNNHSADNNNKKNETSSAAVNVPQSISLPIKENSMLATENEKKANTGPHNNDHENRDDNFGRNNKIVVKRRMLNDADENGNNENAEKEHNGHNDETLNGAFVDAAKSQETEPSFSSDQEISFGRR